MAHVVMGCLAMVFCLLGEAGGLAISGSLATVVDSPMMQVPMDMTALTSRSVDGSEGEPLEWMRYVHSEGRPLEYLRRANGGPTVEFLTWYGRTGNNIIQLANAILYAQAIHATKLVFRTDRNRIPLFDLPEELPIQPRQLPLRCGEFSSTSHAPFYRSCYKKIDIRPSLLQHVQPYWSQEGARACQAETDHPFNGLTIHLRSGDRMHHEDNYAPCRFIDKVVSDHNFSSVRIITELDMKHPCISLLSSSLRLSNVSMVVQSRSVAADACALMNAMYLAVGSPSTFWMALENLNTRIKKLFIPILPTNARKDCTPPTGDIDQKAVSYYYAVEGMRMITQISNSEKADYFGNFPLQKITLKDVCDEEQEVGFPFNSILRTGPDVTSHP